MTQTSLASSPDEIRSEKPAVGMTYGRSRLLLGVGGVGLWVLLASSAIIAGLPAMLAQTTAGSIDAEFLAVALLSLFVLLVQAPFDMLGGYVLPRRHGRSDERFGAFFKRWLRGVSIYQSVYLLSGLLLLSASRAAGAPGLVLVAVTISIAFLAGRSRLAAIIGSLQRTRDNTHAQLGVTPIASPDPGFTGGIGGVLRPREQLVPQSWINSLAPESLALLLRRRSEAVASGLWFRGRVAALIFIWSGMAAAALPVGDLAGTAGGVLLFAALFTLWSFVGLLVLPTLSRRASIAIDGRLIEQGADPDDLSALAASLDAMQDGEPSRPKWIERVFHPIPSVTSRSTHHESVRFACWDVARTSAVLGIAGLSPLGRAVHCNSGRPALWIYLPLD